MTPTEALDAKLKAVSLLSHCAAWGASPLFSNLADGRETVQCLKRAVPVVWDDDVLALTNHANKTFPWNDKDMTSEAIREHAQKYGTMNADPVWHVFGARTPRRIATRCPEDDAFNRRMGLQSSLPDEVDVAALLVIPAVFVQCGMKRGVQYLAFARAIDNDSVFVPTFRFSTVTAIDTAKVGDSAADESLDLNRWSITAWMFLSTVIESCTAHVERSARRRAERAECVSDVHVVQLRRTTREQSGNESERPTEWHCQWLVRGHWRRQWRPKTETHVPTWIAPYVKGPAGMPMRHELPEVRVACR